MTGCKTGDSKEGVTDAHDCVSDDIMMIDAGVEKEELSYTEETHPGNNHSPRYNANERLAGNKESPNKGCSLVENSYVEPSVVISAQAIVDPDINADTNDPMEITAKADGTHLDPPDANVPIERSLKIQAEDQMELDVGNSTKEEELSYGETRTELLPKNEKKEKTSNNEVRVMKLPSENEIKAEELNVGVSELEFPPDIETDGELHTVVTGTELPLDIEIKEQSSNTATDMEVLASNEIKEESLKPELDMGDAVEAKSSNKSFLLDPNASVCDESGTEEEQASFMKELETFHKERCLEFKPPRFYGEPLNCLKLWRAVVRLGGYEQVTSCKLWRQVGESFKPPKTCTTVSWTFRCFYEKALLEYEKHKMRSGELPFNDVSFIEPISTGDQGAHQASGSGRARRDAAARAMQGWHSQRLLGNGEVGDPIIKDKNSTTTPKREKQLKSIGFLKRKKPSSVERAVKAARLKASKSQSGTMVVDIGPSADWVKINVQKTKDCFEVYALVPGLLREEVRVQSDPAGRLVISGQPEQLDNPWGVIPFKKVVSLPSRIDPHQTSAVVTLHGQLFVRVPFEQSDL